MNSTIEKKQESECNYHNIPVYDSENNYLILSNGTFTRENSQNVNVIGQNFSLKSGETVWLTDQGILICRNLQDEFGNDYTVEPNYFLYEFIYLLIYKEKDDYYYLTYEK